jgi:hypothetical protein
MKRRLFFKVLLLTCWLPLLLTAIAVSWETLAITGKSTQYLALGKIAVTVKSPTASGPVDPEAVSADFWKVQKEFLEGDELKRRALHRVLALHPELKESEVQVHVTRTKGSSILKLVAVSGEQKFDRVFLDALLDEYTAAQGEIKTKERFTAVIMEHPDAVVIDKPDMLAPELYAAFAGLGAGLIVMLLAAILVSAMFGPPDQE